MRLYLRTNQPEQPAQSVEASLSSRGQALLAKGTFVLRLEEIRKDSYDPETNPEGAINIGIAENMLKQAELIDYYEKNFRLRPLDLTYGDTLSGSKRLTNAIASYFNDYFTPSRPVEPQHIITITGVKGVLDQLTTAITDPGDAVLVAAPYYNGFDNDLTFRNGVEPIPVYIPLEDALSAAEVKHLEQALLIVTRARGLRVRAVILCNPHNPLGRCYSEDAIIAYGKFCGKHGLHLISDEIYAMSVFPNRDIPRPEPFVSVLAIDFQKHGVDPSQVHVLYGMAKDFGASGFHIGVFASQHNPSLRDAVCVTSGFAAVGSPGGILWATLLEDKAYLREYLGDNQARLRDAYEWFADWLRFHKLEYMNVSAGNVVMVDLRSWILDDDKFEVVIPGGRDMDLSAREEALLSFLWSRKILVRSGRQFHGVEAGWFRVSFSIYRETLKLALRRMEDALNWPRWAGLG